MITQSMFKQSTAVMPLLMWQHFTDDDGGEDPFLKRLPLGYRDSWLVSWDQKDNPYGKLPLGALDAAPTFMAMPGIKVYEAEPGVYRGYTRVDERELTVGREPGTLGDPIKRDNRLADVNLYFGEMLANTIYGIYADLGVNGQINNVDRHGNQHSYQIQNYSKLNVSAWASNPTTATPIDDFRTAQSTLNKGTSSRFGQKSEVLMTDEAITTLLATTQVRNTFRSNYGATYMAPFDNNQLTGVQPPLNGDRSLNALFFGMGLPKIVPWNRGYYANLADAQNRTKANFQKFLPNTAAVWLGYRPQGQQVGQISFARHAGLMDPGAAADYGVVPVRKPGSVSEFGKGVYVQVKYVNEQPHHYLFEIGANICPEVWYEDAMASINWT